MQPQMQSQPDSSGRLASRDLPSTTTSGLRNDNAAASIAASKGWSSQLQLQQQQQQQQQKPQYQSYQRPLSQETKTFTPARPASAPANPTSLKAATTAASAASAALQARSPTRSDLQNMGVPQTGFNSSVSQQQAYTPRSPPPPQPQFVQTSPYSQSTTLQQAPPIVVEPPQSRAAALAKTNSSASSRAAATLAIGSAANRHQRSTSGESAVSLSSPNMVTSSSWGSSAANYAYRNRANTSGSGTTSSGAGPYSSQVMADKAALGRQPSLRAAKGAMRAAAADSAASGRTATRTRNRAISTPVAYRHQKNPMSESVSVPAGSSSVASQNAADALSAAALAHGPTTGRDRSAYLAEAGSVPYTNMNRQMYTSRPPVSTEVDEQNYNDTIHASAVAMAKRMYNPKAGKSLIGNNNFISSGSATVGGNGQYNTALQEAAYKLAQERLDKLQKEHQANRGYRDHYMDPNLLASTMTAPTNATSGGQSSNRRSAVRARLRRRRSASDSEVVEDRKRSLEIRNQMSLLTTRISEVDQEKRRKDRQAVLAAAQRNVRAQLEDIDEQVFNETGKLQPSRLANWEHKAHLAAQARLDSRRAAAPQSNQINLGGGRFMDRDEVDKIAARRVQPLLDDINEKAEKERERQALLREEEEARKEEIEGAKQRDRELKSLYQKLKQEDKEGRREAKRNRALKISTGKIERQAGTSDDATGEQGSGQESPTSPQPPTSASPTTPPHTSGGDAGGSSALTKLFIRSPKSVVTRSRGASSGSAVLAPASAAATGGELAEAAEGHTSPISSPVSDEFPSTSPTSRVRNWLKTRFAVRPRAKSAASAGSWGEGSATTEKSFIGGHALTSVEGSSAARSVPGFIGGAALTGGAGGSTISLGNRSTSMRDVALAGRQRSATGSDIGIYDGDYPDGALRTTIGSGSNRNSRASSNFSAVGTAAANSGGGSGGSIVMTRTATNGTSDDQFVEARDRFSDVSSAIVSLPGGAGRLHSTGGTRSPSFSPPRGIRDPATKKSPSPIRDSRFHENLEDS